MLAKNISTSAFLSLIIIDLHWKENSNFEQKTNRKNSDIPREAIVTNYNRVLILPRVRVEDQGEYVCRAYNDKVSITGSVTLSIQAR